MESPTTPILGVPISTFGMDRAVDFCAAQARSGGGGYVCFANVHTVTESQNDPVLKRVLSRALLAVADGLPLVWSSRLRGPKIESRVCGPDFMTLFLERVRDVPTGFIGGAPGQAERLAERFGRDATCFSPPMRPFSAVKAREDWAEFIRRNGDRPVPKAIWVGLGAPKQELWMEAVSETAPDVLFFGVGAAFDFLTGSKKRAPVWMQKSGLEWFFRLVQEPRRLWRRYFVTNSRYLAYSLLDLLTPVPVLTAQLLLTLFMPPFDLGTRSVYLGDLWFYFWVPLLSWKFYRQDSARARSMLKWVAGAGVIFATTYLHGFFRPSLVEELKAVGLTVADSDAFSLTREAVVSSRFFVWFWAATWTSYQSFDRDTLIRLCRNFAIAFGVISAVMIFAKMSPEYHSALGRTYGYDPMAFPWAGRIYGVFRSPIEAGMTIGFASMILLAAPKASRNLNRVALFGTLIGVVATRTLSAVISGVGAGVAYVFSRVALALRGVLVLGAGAAIFGFYHLSTEPGFAREKMIDFAYRFGPWKVYLEAMTERIDFAVFGLGYANYHVDNSYIFLLSRGGLLLFGFVGWAAYRGIRAGWSRWNAPERMLVSYFLISGLTIDSIILRPMIAVLVVAALPLLARKEAA